MLKLEVIAKGKTIIVQEYPALEPGVPIIIAAGSPAAVCVTLKSLFQAMTGEGKGDA